MKKFFTLLTVTFLTLFFGINTHVFAADADPKKLSNAKEFVEKLGNDIINIAKKENISEEVKKDNIITTIDTAIDSNWIARFVLGKNYRSASDQQKERFTELYRKFMINTYGPKFKNYNGREFKVTDVVEQNRFFLVKAEFLPKDSSTPILVDFRVKERKGKLVVLDFIAEGISLIETQRSEFNSAISQSGMETFLDNLEERVTKLKSN